MITKILAQVLTYLSRATQKYEKHPKERHLKEVRKVGD